MSRFPGKKEVVMYKGFTKDDPRSQCRIPYLSYIDPTGKYETAIYINHLAPSFASILIEKYFKLDERVEAMCKFVIHWASIKRLLGPSKYYLSSYALILKVIFFLQIQNPPVIDSIQGYADRMCDSASVVDIPSFKNMLKRVPDKNEYIKYRLGNIILDTINLTFIKVDSQILISDLGYVKNKETVGELLIKFFYYFGIDYPVLDL